MHQDPMTGHEFRIRRRALKLSQSALADHWGLHRETIIRIEQTDTVPGHYADALRNVEREVNHGQN